MFFFHLHLFDPPPPVERMLARLAAWDRIPPRRIGEPRPAPTSGPVRGRRPRDCPG